MALSFSQLENTVYQQIIAPRGNQITTFIQGRPGGGKSACTRALARRLAKELDIAPQQIVEFNASLRDPVDIMGIPFKSEDGSHSRWLPPEEFYNLRQGVGYCILILEELTDAPMAMQNPLCRVVLDRYAGNLKLSDKLIILATGNRVEDRSGANRMSTKLGNRMRVLDFQESVEDWVKWARNEGDISEDVINFILYRPNLLSDFDPKRVVNPTPRAWESVSRVPTFTEDPNGALYFQHVAGHVGEGPAHEFCGFRKIWHELPDFTALLSSPKKYPIPTDMAVLYATVLKLASMINENTDSKVVDAILTYMSRTKVELQAMAIRDMLTKPEACSKVVQSTLFPTLAKGLNLGF